jgi:hypothetical protein
MGHNPSAAIDKTALFKNGTAGTCLTPQYIQRQPEKTVLYQVVQEHLETLLAEAKERSEHGCGYPQSVQKAFYRYTNCGIFSRGFARCRCQDCGDEFLVPFSFQLRCLCPSCSTRRMHDTALRLSDTLPLAPYRQWVLSPPWHPPACAG